LLIVNKIICNTDLFMSLSNQHC